MSARVRSLRVPVLCVLTVLISVWVHEAGHALAGILSGAKVKNIVVFSVRPHVTLEGAASAEHTPVTAVAGTALFLSAWALFVVAAPAGAASAAMISVSSVIAFIESCGWILSSLLFPYGPKSEDAWKFLEHSQINPGAAGAVSLTVGLLALYIFLHGRPSWPKLPPHTAPSQ